MSQEIEYVAIMCDVSSKADSRLPKKAGNKDLMPRDHPNLLKYTHYATGISHPSYIF